MASYEVLESYGITLRRLTADKIELVRRWRNDPSISQYMEYREHITAEQQKAWFARINNDHNFYFIVEYHGKDMGLINIRNIDYNDLNAEFGAFFWYLDEVPMLAIKSHFALMDFAFYTLGLSTLQAHVLQDNTRSIRITLTFGFQLMPGQDQVNNQLYKLSVEDYERAKNRMRRFL